MLLLILLAFFSLVGNVHAQDSSMQATAEGDSDTDFGGWGADGEINLAGSSVVDLHIQSTGRIVVVRSQFSVYGFQFNGATDLSFGNNGISTFVSNDTTSASALQEDDKIVAVGGTNNFVVARFLADGRPDLTFGSNGVATVDFAGQRDTAFGLAIQENGKIIIVGVAKVGGDDDFAIARLHPDGSLDLSFHDDGKVTTGFGEGDDIAYDVVLEPPGRPGADQKIIVVGRIDDSSIFDFDMDWGLARYSVNGTLDTTFGSNGRVRTGFGGDWDTATAVALRPDRRIVVHGYAGDLPWNPAIAQYLSDGTLDPTFRGGGTMVDRTVTTSLWTTSLALQPDGKLLTSGTEVIRYEANGARDATFGENGMLPPPRKAGAALLLLPDGRFLTGGFIDQYSARVVRYRPNGALDVAGATVSDFGHGDDRIFDIAALSDGSIVALGESTGHPVLDTQVALAKFDADGAPDRSFGEHGLALGGLAKGDFGRGLAISENGDAPSLRKYIVAGYREGFTFNELAVWRFRADGSPDREFNLLGFNAVANNLGDYFGQDVVVQSSGKIVVVGFAESPTSNDINRRFVAMVRFQSDGKVDRTFGEDGDGEVWTSVGSGYVSARGAFGMTDGRILVVGGHAGNFYALRYTREGVLDPTFGDSGFVEVDLPGNDEAYDVVVLANGTIVIGGFHSGDFALVFLNSDGSPCSAVCGLPANNPRIVTDFGGEESLYGLAVQEDGRIVAVGGGRGINPTSSSVLLARYHFNNVPSPGYRLDSSFGSSGKVVVEHPHRSLARAVAIDAQGRLIIGGYVQNGVNDDFLITRRVGSPPPPPSYSIFLPSIVTSN